MVLNSFDLRPMYLQVVDLFVGRIVSRQWPPGSLIPAEADIACELSLSFGTVRRAFDVLDSFGVLDRSAGQGIGLRDVTSEAFLSRLSAIRLKNRTRISGAIDVTAARLGQASAETANDLGIGLHDPVLISARNRHHGGRIFLTELAESPVPASAAEPSTNLLDMAMNRWFPHGLATRAQERVAIDLTRATDRPLGVEVGEPILLLRQVIFGHDGRPLERRVARCYLGDDLIYEA